MCKYYSQFSQCFPDVPAGHSHPPVTGSHRAPLQLQECAQPAPNFPSGQSARVHSEDQHEEKLKVTGPDFLRSGTYPGHSLHRDDPVDIYAGNPRSHDDMTLQGDTHSYAHSGLHKYQGHILQTDQGAV